MLTFIASRPENILLSITLNTSVAKPDRLFYITYSIYLQVINVDVALIFVSVVASNGNFRMHINFLVYSIDTASSLLYR